MLKIVEGLNAFLEHEWIDEIHVFKYFYNYMHVIFWSPGLEVVVIHVILYSRVSFCDDSLLQPLSGQTKHSRFMVHHCHNSSILSLLSALLGLF